jgi:aldose 1-epimerase
MNILKEPFGTAANGQEIFLFTLSNQSMIVKITTYGGIITSIIIPDKRGKLADVALGFYSLENYLKKHPFFGAIIGRYGNRIAGGKFGLNGVQYTLAKNDGKNHLHGGRIGFDKVVWDAEEIRTAKEIGVKLTYLSKDGEEGYPGNLTTVVQYLLSDQNELILRYEAKTDKPTVVNLTNHTYFNLAGEGSGDILTHEIKINADNITAVGKGLIPTGELMPVKGSPFDFTTSQAIGARIKEIKLGYDHNYVLNLNKPGELTPAAKVYEPESGRIMEVSTTEPGMQFYTGNFLNGKLKGKLGRFYHKHGAFCLETQHFPDSPNHPEFPSTVLNPGETYRQETIYKFSVQS